MLCEREDLPFPYFFMDLFQTLCVHRQYMGPSWHHTNLSFLHKLAYLIRDLSLNIFVPVQLDQ